MPQFKRINYSGLSFLYGPVLTSTHGKTIALIRQTYVSKVMPLPFNMPSRLVITFLPRSKRLLISWLQSPSAVILEPKKIKSVTLSIVSPSICHELSHVQLFATPWTVTPWPPCPSPTPRACSNSYSCFAHYFVGKVMSLFFNVLSRFIISFLPRSKHL